LSVPYSLKKDASASSAAAFPRKTRGGRAVKSTNHDGRGAGVGPASIATAQAVIIAGGIIANVRGSGARGRFALTENAKPMAARIRADTLPAGNAGTRTAIPPASFASGAGHRRRPGSITVTGCGARWQKHLAAAGT